MIINEYKLNGLIDNTLPDILPNENGIIKINDTNTGYEISTIYNTIVYLESTSSIYEIKLSQYINTNIIMFNFKGIINQTLEINNDLPSSFNHSYNFTIYTFGVNSQNNTFKLTGNNWLIEPNHFNINTNFTAGSSNDIDYTTLEPNSSQVDFIYYFNENDPYGCYWIVRRIGPFN